MAHTVESYLQEHQQISLASHENQRRTAKSLQQDQYPEPTVDDLTQTTDEELALLIVDLNLHDVVLLQTSTGVDHHLESAEGHHHLSATPLHGKSFAQVVSVVEAATS
jgi:hypothetical protein